MRRESGVVKSWGQELEVESSRAEPGAWAGSSREPGLSQVRSRAQPGVERPGLGLEGLFWRLVKKCLEWS